MTEQNLNQIIAKNIVKQLESQNKTQLELAEYMGVSQATVSNWCKAIKMPRMSKIDAICSFFNIKRSELMDENGARAIKKRKSISIPVYGRVAAGIPLEMIEDIIDFEEIPDDMARHGEFFALQIHGDSMEPRMKEGDVVIVRQQEDAETGEIVIVTVNGTDAACKRLKKYRDGIELISTNPSYESKFYNAQEVAEKPVRILGKVVELRAKF